MSRCACHCLEDGCQKCCYCGREFKEIFGATNQTAVLMAAREQAERAERERRNEALANGEHWKRKRDYVIELSPGELKNARVDERQGGPVEISTIEGPCTVLRLFAVVSNRWVIDEIEKLEKENKELHAKIERLKTVFEDAGL